MTFVELYPKVEKDVFSEQIYFVFSDIYIMGLE